MDLMDSINQDLQEARDLNRNPGRRDSNIPQATPPDRPSAQAVKEDPSGGPKKSGKRKKAGR